MYRFLLRPRWIVFTIVMALLVLVMVNLGFWQLRRWDERKELNSEITARSEEAAQPVDTVLAAHPDPADAEWRLVTATGEYEPSGQVLIRDRSQYGAAGFFVATPLRLEDGRFLAVVRGFIPAGATAPAPPSGPVSVEGRLRESQRQRHSWETTDPDNEVLDTLSRMDVPRLDQQVDGDALPMYVEAATTAPPDLTIEPVAPPEFDDGPHLSYAGQWFLFSLLAVVGYVLAVRKSSAAFQRRHAAEQLDDVGGTVQRVK